MDDPYRNEHLLFNGKFKLVTVDDEVKMSHWITSFGIVDTTTGNYILDFPSLFHLADFEESGNILKLSFRIYPDGSNNYEVEINLLERTFAFENKTKPLCDLYESFKQS